MIFLYLSCREDGFKIENIMLSVILTAIISIPLLLIFLRNAISYDDEKIYFYRFIFLTKVIQMKEISYIEITIIHRGRGAESDYLNVILKDNRRYKFSISHLNSEDISSMEEFIRERYNEIKILPARVGLD